MPMNVNQARVIDPILTKIAIGYTNEDFIGHELFPDVDIVTRAAKIIIFTKNSFRKVNARRAAGSDVKRITVGFESGPISINQDSLEGVVPAETAEEANKVPGINMGNEAVAEVLDILLLNREIDKAKIAQNLNNYANENKATLAGTDKWSDPASDPEKDILEAREAIRRKIGRYPNKLTLSAGAYASLCVHPKVKAQFKYTSGDSITESMLARLFKVAKVVVGKAIYLEEDAADDAEAKDIWFNSAILAYVPINVRTRRVPSFGYNYKLIGHPNVEKPYYWNPSKSWIYPVTHECQPALTSADAGFLFNAVVE